MLITKTPKNNFFNLEINIFFLYVFYQNYQMYIIHILTNNHLFLCKLTDVFGIENMTLFQSTTMMIMCINQYQHLILI